MNDTRKREPARSGQEQDVLSRSRKQHAFAQRPGICAEVKRAVRRRERRNGRTETTREDRDEI